MVIKGQINGFTGLVCSGCYNKVPQTGGSSSKQNLFLTALEAGSLRCECLKIWCLVRLAFWFTNGHPLCVLIMAEGTREFSGFFFIRSWIPWGLHLHDLNTSHSAHLQILHWGLGFSIIICIQSNSKQHPPFLNSLTVQK